ncbi:MAG: hypothetical protein L7F77_11625, partial [Candidatus Magnetominusculus sp. LBB02]|nr:hypothetical protein [Candidatus Magnetominusculus sp. LBB02]
YKQVGNILGEANCISGIGLILIRDDKTKDGIDEVLKAVSLYEKIKDKQSIGLAYNDLADELEKKADYQPQALEYRTKATEILKSVQWSGLQRRGDAV